MNNFKSACITQKSTTYPGVFNCHNPALEKNINRKIKKTAAETLPTGRYKSMNIISAGSKYDITVNKNEILSMKLENYYYPENMASGITTVRGLTINLITGKNYRLRDLFDPDSNYQDYLNNIINNLIRENNIPLIEDFPGITGYEEFYLTEDELVIIYQRYQLTPGSYGVLELEIPYWELTPVIIQDSPIYKLLES